MSGRQLASVGTLQNIGRQGGPTAGKENRMKTAIYIHCLVRLFLSPRNIRIVFAILYRLSRHFDCPSVVGRQKRQPLSADGVGRQCWLVSWTCLGFKDFHLVFYSNVRSIWIRCRVIRRSILLKKKKNAKTYAVSGPFSFYRTPLKRKLKQSL